MKILITGGTGFLGSALTSEIIEKSDHEVLVFGRNEAKLSRVLKDNRVSTFCGDVKDKPSVMSAVKEFKPNLIIHTAALKRIDTCQEFPSEAVKTNIDGTYNIIEACKEYGTDLCFISTDKACEPCTTYGATKYMAEQLVRRESQKGLFKGYVIRYGNVLNSTGSVLGIWEKQFDSMKRVQVRDKSMTRFFWKVEESIKYIMECIDREFIKNGDIFIPKLKSMNIYDMASYLYNSENVIITGRTHTEKTHECLDGNTCSKNYVVNPSEML